MPTTGMVPMSLQNIEIHPNDGYDKNLIKWLKWDKGLNHLKQNCPILRFAMQISLRAGVENKYVKRKTVLNTNLNKNA